MNRGKLALLLAAVPLDAREEGDAGEVSARASDAWYTSPSGLSNSRAKIL